MYEKNANLLFKKIHKKRKSKFYKNYLKKVKVNNNYFFIISYIFINFDEFLVVN